MSSMNPISTRLGDRYFILNWVAINQNYVLKSQIVNEAIPVITPYVRKHKTKQICKM